MNALVLIVLFVGAFLGQFLQPWANHYGEHFVKRRMLRRYPEGTAWCKHCGQVFMGRDFANSSKTQMDPTVTEVE